MGKTCVGPSTLLSFRLPDESKQLPTQFLYPALHECSISSAPCRRMIGKLLSHHCYNSLLILLLESSSTPFYIAKIATLKFLFYSYIGNRKARQPKESILSSQTCASTSETRSCRIIGRKKAISVSCSLFTV